MSYTIHRIHAVVGLTGIPRSTLYAMIKSGNFPKPIKLSERSVGWLDSDIREWQEQLIKKTKQA